MTAAAPDPEACREQLARILASPDFDATDRDRRFLAHIVEESLAGRGDRIKAYSIALEVFGRGASFDPRTDPIVRVEAGHLRRALDRYYLSAGRDDPVVIAVPKGGYAPTFGMRTPYEDDPPPRAPVQAPSDPLRRRGLTAAAVFAVVALAFVLGLAAGRLWPGPAASGPQIPDILVVPLTAPPDDAGATAVAEGLTGEIISEIARFRDIVVVAPTASAVTRPPRYALEGGVARDGDDLRVRLRLRRQQDGAVIWARGYRVDLDSERPLAAEMRIASLAATEIGQPYGAVFLADAAAIADRRRDGDAYACIIDYFSFRSTLDAASYRAARTCLEEAVARFPNYATARGLLAQIEVDGRRFGFDGEATYAEGLAEAQRALALDPGNVRALEAKMMALYIAGDIEEALRVGASAVEINPNDTEMLGEYGYRLALSGRWDEGCRAMEDALARNPGPVPYYETGLALCAYIAGRTNEAADRIRAAAFPQVPIYHVMAAALFAEAGETADARRERDWLARNAPGLLADPAAQVGPRVGRAEDWQRFSRSLARAGIPMPAPGADGPMPDERMVPPG